MSGKHISKIFNRITNDYNLSQSQQRTQVTDIQGEEIKMNISLRVEGTNEKLRRILRSHKIRSTFYNVSSFCERLCKLKDRVATEDKNNVNCEIDYINCEAAYLRKFKRSLKSRSDEQKRSVRNWDCEKNEVPKHC